MFPCGQLTPQSGLHAASRWPVGLWVYAFQCVFRRAARRDGGQSQVVMAASPGLLRVISSDIGMLSPILDPHPEFGRLARMCSSFPSMAFRFPGSSIPGDLLMDTAGPS